MGSKKKRERQRQAKEISSNESSHPVEHGSEGCETEEKVGTITVETVLVSDDDEEKLDAVPLVLMGGGQPVEATSSGGKAEFTDLPKGVYEIQADSPDGQEENVSPLAESIRVRLPSGRDKTVTYEFRPIANVKFTLVQDDEDETKVAGAKLHVHLPEKKTKRFLTNAGGVLDLKRIPKGDYTLQTIETRQPMMLVEATEE